MYRYETHCHTLYASACSSLDAETMVALYLANGYDGIVVTDHFFNGNTAISPSLGWKERVGAFYGAYMNVRKEGEKRGLKVFFGFEYSYSGTDFLAYGMGPDFLCRHPEMMALSVKSWLAFAKKSGALCIQAHPYREADYIDHIRLFPSDTDGMETVNAARDERCNRLADILADEYSLLKTGGSALHSVRQPLLSGVETEERMDSLPDLMRAIRSGAARPFLAENKFIK